MDKLNYTPCKHRLLYKPLACSVSLHVLETLSGAFT